MILNSAAQTNFPGNGVELKGPVSKMQSDKTERKVRKRYMKSQVYMIVYKHYIQTELRHRRIWWLWVVYKSIPQRD